MKVRGIGGGSTYTPELVIGFLERQDVLPLSELALMDISEERLSIVGGFAQRTIRSAGDLFTVALPTDRRAALAGASYVVTLLIPLGSVLISAFKEHSAVVLNPAALPTSIDFDNFARAAERARLIDAMVHTVIIVVFTELLNLVVSYLAAYGIARIKIFETMVVESILGAGLPIPAFALMLPVFLLAANLGVLYEPGYIIVFYAASRIPFSVIVLANAMRCIPCDFEDSARIDGANLLQVIRHVFLPLTRSALITIVVLNLLHVWNEYLVALILLPGCFRTIQLALPLLKGEFSVDFALMSAGVVISLIPVYIFFVIFQEQIVKGLTVGGAEG